MIAISLFSILIENTSSGSYAERTEMLDKPIISIQDIALPLIKKYEGLWLEAYHDHGRCSIWYGTRAKSCKEKITKDEAERRLLEYVTPLIEEVKNDFPNLHIGWQSALVSFRYNCPRWYKDVKKNWIERHSLWCKKAWGKVLEWLVKRRAEESNMIFTK